MDLTFLGAATTVFAARDQAKLAALITTLDWERLVARALYVVQRSGVVPAWLDSEAMRIVAEGESLTSDLR